MGKNILKRNKKKSVKFLGLRANEGNWYKILQFVEIKSNM